MHKFKVAQIPSRRDFKAKSLALEIKAVYIWFAEQQAVLGMTGLSFIMVTSGVLLQAEIRFNATLSD